METCVGNEGCNDDADPAEPDRSGPRADLDRPTEDQAEAMEECDDAGNGADGEEEHAARDVGFHYFGMPGVMDQCEKQEDIEYEPELGELRNEIDTEEYTRQKAGGQHPNSDQEIAGDEAGTELRNLSKDVGLFHVFIITKTRSSLGEE